MGAPHTKIAILIGAYSGVNLGDVLSFVMAN